MSDCEAPRYEGDDQWSRCGGCVPCLIEQCEERDKRVAELERALIEIQHWNVQDPMPCMSGKASPPRFPRLQKIIDRALGRESAGGGAWD